MILEKLNYYSYHMDCWLYWRHHILNNKLNLSTYSKEQIKKISGTAEVVIEFTHEDKTEEDFETKLRKLESLRKDGLITKGEYQRKRKEIMYEKW